MPRQNTSPSEFPAAVLQQIEQLAQALVRIRKSQGATQAQWAAALGVSQPTMARLERGDPAIATATYVACLYLANPQMNLMNLLPALPTRSPSCDAPTQVPALAPAQPTSNVAEEFADLLAQWTAATL